MFIFDRVDLENPQSTLNHLMMVPLVAGSVVRVGSGLKAQAWVGKNPKPYLTPRVGLGSGLGSGLGLKYSSVNGGIEVRLHCAHSSEFEQSISKQLGGQKVCLDEQKVVLTGVDPEKWSEPEQRWFKLY
ncbi:hypothetical protein C8R43DRAFT_962471 [Mycena crocata]|nr:hypothetical protein C8R43DRAFT_962471 [Mycena crocata]